MTRPRDTAVHTTTRGLTPAGPGAAVSACDHGTKKATRPTAWQQVTRRHEGPKRMPTDAVSHHPPIDETPRPESVGEIALNDVHETIARNTTGAFVGIALVIGGLLAFDWALEWLRGGVRW